MYITHRLAEEGNAGLKFKMFGLVDTKEIVEEGESKWYPALNLNAILAWLPSHFELSFDDTEDVFECV